VQVDGIDPLIAAIERLTPAQNRAIMVRSLLECAALVEENAKRKQIISGGAVAETGPKGGRRIVQRKAASDRLTSRSGALRDSISTSRSGLPVHIEVGTPYKYGRAHEHGFSGTVSVPKHKREITQAWGKPIERKRITVRAHSRRLNLPKRPFLQPAVQAMGPQFPKVFMANWRKLGRV
jgi:phage gpG-like protein